MLPLYHAKVKRGSAKKEKYFMRNDRKGDVYDREAMEKVSKQLGHNRIDVIAGHYLYTPKVA